MGIDISNFAKPQTDPIQIMGAAPFVADSVTDARAQATKVLAAGSTFGYVIVENGALVDIGAGIV